MIFLWEWQRLWGKCLLDNMYKHFIILLLLFLVDNIILVEEFAIVNQKQHLMENQSMKLT